MREKDPQKIEAIYQAALKLVLCEGFSALKMSDVAKEAKIATGTLYIYFENKEDLINQLYAHLKKQSAAAFLVGYSDKMPFEEGFKKIWYNYVLTQLKQPEAAAFLEQYYRSPYLRDSVKKEADKLLEPIFSLLDRGKKEKKVKDISTDLLAIQLSGAIAELVRWHMNGQIKVTESMLDHAYELAWHSIRK